MQKDVDIIIKQADKGSATVVMSKDDYLALVISHLDNTQFNEILSEDPTELFAEEITSILTEMKEKEILNKDTFDFLQP